MIDDIFFKENLYSFLSKNDSMNSKYLTNSIKDFSYMNSKDLLMQVNLIHNYNLYIKFKENTKFRYFSNMDEYFDLVDNFLENEKIIQSHFLFENDKLTKIKKSRINKMCGFKFSTTNKIKLLKESLKNPSDSRNDLLEIFKDIFIEIEKNINQEYRIIVENYNDYLSLINYIYLNNIKVKFNEYRFLKDSKIYRKVLKYLSKNEFNKIKLIELISINTSDYYEYFFNNFIYQMIKDFNSKDQFLFYLFMYKDLYIAKKFNKNSKILIEPINFLSLIELNDFMILSYKNSTFKEEDLKFYLNRLLYITKFIKVYSYKFKKHNNRLNISNIINDDKK